MEWNYKGSFLRDWEKIHNRILTKALRKKFEEIEKAKDTQHISHLKKLRNYETRYKEVQNRDCSVQMENLLDFVCYFKK